MLNGVEDEGRQDSNSTGGAVEAAPDSDIDLYTELGLIEGFWADEDIVQMFTPSDRKGVISAPAQSPPTQSHTADVHTVPPELSDYSIPALGRKFGLEMRGKIASLPHTRTWLCRPPGEDWREDIGNVFTFVSVFDFLSKVRGDFANRAHLVAPKVRNRIGKHLGSPGGMHKMHQILNEAKPYLSLREDFVARITAKQKGA